MKIVAILGSVTPPGRLSAAMDGALERLAAKGVETEFLDLGQLTLGFADGRHVEQLDDDTAKLVAAVRGADGVVFASPVYRATITGALKNALDLLPVDALMGKPCGIVAMGASAHHYLGCESHMKDILAWFGAVTLPTGVYLTSKDFTDGVLSDAAMETMDGICGTVAAMAQALRGTSFQPAPMAAAYLAKG